MVEDSDWRLRGQEKRLKGITLYKKSWRQTRPNWDHDHCEFCGAKFMGQDVPDVLHEGYADDKKYHWICENCFNDFKERFCWKLEN